MMLLPLRRRQSAARMVRARAQAIARRPRLLISVAMLPLVMGLVAGVGVALGRRRARLVKMVREVTPTIAHRRRRLVQRVRRGLVGARSHAARSAQPAHR